MSSLVNYEAIQKEYERLGYSAGWRFMTSPVKTFSDPKLLIVSLNPSGRVEHGPRWSQEEGSAYLIENWGSADVGRAPLQIQIQRLVETLGLDFAEVASAHFVPFRSQRWADLDRAKEAVSFSRKLWREFATTFHPDWVVCLGSEVGRHMVDILDVTKVESVPTGWGAISMTIGRTPWGGRLVAFPHLGTFKLFSNQNCAAPVRSALGMDVAA
jgi:hypothetical protein